MTTPFSFASSSYFQCPDTQREWENQYEDHLRYQDTYDEIGFLCILLQNCHEKVNFCISSPVNAYWPNPSAPPGSTTPDIYTGERASERSCPNSFVRAVSNYPDLPRSVSFYQIDKKSLHDTMAQRLEKFEADVRLLPHDNQHASCEDASHGIPKIILAYTSIRMKWDNLRAVWFTKDPQRFPYTQAEVPEHLKTDSDKTLYLAERLTHVYNLATLLWKKKSLSKSFPNSHASLGGEKTSTGSIESRKFEDIAELAKTTWANMQVEKRHFYPHSFETTMRKHFLQKGREMEILIERAKLAHEVTANIQEPNIYSIFNTTNDTAPVADQIALTVDDLDCQSNTYGDPCWYRDPIEWFDEQYTEQRVQDYLRYMFNALNELEEIVKDAFLALEKSTQADHSVTSKASKARL